MASLVINTLWPPAPAPASPCTSPLPAAATGSKKAASLVKETGGSALLQVVPLVLLSRSDAAIGTAVHGGSSTSGGAVRPRPLPPHVDLGDLAEVLEGARAEGFTLAGVCAVPLHQQSGGSPAGQRDLAKLLRLPAPQAQVLATASVANRAGATAAGVYAGSPVVALALSRDNASAHLPMRVQQLAEAAVGGASSSSATLQQQGAQRHQRGLAAAVGISAPAPASRAAAEEVLLHFFDLLAESSGYSICLP